LAFKKEKETIMPIQNKTMLITYSDSLGNNLKDLYENLEKYFGDAVGGVHLLPFFPSTGDRGFAPVDYDQVDPGKMSNAWATSTILCLTL